MQDFRALLGTFAPTLASSVGQAAFEARSAAFFEEAHAINAELNAAAASAAAGAAAGDDDDDRPGGVNPDALSAEAFVALCDRYGLVPLRRAGFVAGAAEGDGASASASEAAAAAAAPAVSAADEVFAPVARPPPIALRRTSAT